MFLISYSYIVYRMCKLQLYGSVNKFPSPMHLTAISFIYIRERSDQER